MQTAPARRHRRLAPGALAALALAAVGEARAGTATGSLGVSVEVVQSCRVTGADGTSALVACSGGAATGAKGRVGATAAAAAAPRGAAAPARVVVEPAADGPGWLTVLY